MASHNWWTVLFRKMFSLADHVGLRKGLRCMLYQGGEETATILRVLFREATAQLARQLPELIRALDSSGSGGHSRAQRRLRLQRGAARPAAEAAAEAAAAYDAAARGVASAATTLEAHWGRMAPAMQAVAEGELHAWMGAPCVHC